VYYLGKPLVSRWLNENTYNGQFIPNGGLPTNPAGQNLGDPANAERDLRRMYNALVAFRAKHGRMPKTPWELLEAAKRGEVDLNEEDFINPDMLFSDNESLRAQAKTASEIPTNVSYGFSWLAPRADGSPQPTFPPEDKPIKWVATDAYERANRTIFRGLKYESRPAGFQMVLWSNGQITRDDITKMLNVRDSDGSWRPLADGEKPNGREVITNEDLYKRLDAGTLFKR
jgi:hypothetical protein